MDSGDDAGLDAGHLPLAELRRIAFARPASGDSALADMALRELNRRNELSRAEEPEVSAPPQPRAEARGMTPRPIVTPVEMPANDMPSAAVDESDSIRSPRRPLAIAGIAIAGLLVGAIAVGGIFAASGTRFGASANASPTPTATATVSGEPPSAYPLTLERGDVAASNDWFAKPQTDNDSFPDPETLTSFGIDPGSTRRIADFPPHSAIFVGRTESGLCLLWVSTDMATPHSTLTCASNEAFARAGLLLQDGTSSYTWNGRNLVSSIGAPEYG
jgi:hypothetical protein